MTPTNGGVSRRETLTLLLAGLSALGMGVSGCSRGGGTTKEGSAGGSDDTDDTDEPGSGPPDPELDVARLDDALTAALNQTPWADRYPNLAADAQAGIEALRSNGLHSSANSATYLLNGVGANLSAVLAVALADSRSTTEPTTDTAALSAEMVAELQVAAAGVRGELDTSLAELTGVLGGDTAPANPALNAEMASLESDLRTQMHELGVSGQSILNGMLNRFQASRADVAQESSVAQTGERVDIWMEGLASDADVAEWSEGLRQKLPRELRELTGLAGRGAPPPPDETTDAVCTVVGWIDWIVNLSKALHDASSALASRVSDYVDELGDDFSYFYESYARWERAEYSQVAADQLKSKIDGAVNGVVSEMAEEECDALAAVFVLVFWFMGLIGGIVAYAEIMASVMAAVGATPGGWAIALILVLLMVFLLQFTLWILCGVIEVLPAMQALGGQCNPTP